MPRRGIGDSGIPGRPSTLLPGTPVRGEVALQQRLATEVKVGCLDVFTYPLASSCAAIAAALRQPGDLVGWTWQRLGFLVSNRPLERVSAASETLCTHSSPRTCLARVKRRGRERAARAFQIAPRAVSGDEP